MKFPLFPPQASTIARQVDYLYFYLLAVCGLVLLGILVVMVYFLFKYRRGKPVNRVRPNLPVHTMEITWTVLPTLIFMSFFTFGAIVYYNQQRIPDGAMEINVVGKQWMWKIQHPGGQREIDELHVPVGRPVKLILASQDVIHSFFLPAFRIKQDVVPGRYTTEWFQATKVGTFNLFCAEYCGKDHSRMVGKVVVMNPADYQAWLTQGAPQPSLVTSGERLFREAGCSGCHMGSTIVRAPRLEGLFGRPVPLNGGQVVVADDKYLHDSIVLPGNQIAAGYDNLMPSFKGKLSEEQIFELIAYLKSLGNKAPETTQR